MKIIWKKSQINIFGKYEFQKVEICFRNKLDISIYDNERLSGFGESILVEPEVDFNLNLRDDVAFPTRGVRLKV
ncbi:MAG: hypothetical protein P8M17_02970 [Saprospiraceae bacterium]|nr:hypothetical protein [Saprospiraceae bacterium]